MDIKNNHSPSQFKWYASPHSELIRGKPTVPMKPQLKGKLIHYKVAMGQLDSLEILKFFIQILSFVTTGWN